MCAITCSAAPPHNRYHCLTTPLTQSQRTPYLLQTPSGEMYELQLAATGSTDPRADTDESLSSRPDPCFGQFLQCAALVMGNPLSLITREVTATLYLWCTEIIW